MFTICSRPQQRKRNRKIEFQNQNQPLADDLVRLLPKAECLNETLFRDLAHARAAIATWVYDYNTARPHSAIGYATPAAFFASRRSHRPAAPELIDGSARPAVASTARMGKLNLPVPDHAG
jgi:transposase InsO family protein